MKTLNIKFVLVAIFLMGAVMAFAQQPELQYFRTNDRDGLNVFETSKKNDVEFKGVTVRVGGDFAMQFQGLSQSGDSVNNLPTNLANNFNLPSANLNLDVQLADGVRMHMRTYLSARHHTEAYVKGGYLQMDKLDFIKPGFLSGFMNVATIRVGMDEFNYGDTHFRRSDNARAIYNPFVGNYIMDAFSTEPFAELTIQNNGFIGVIGLTNGRLNQAATKGDGGYVFFGKLGIDKQASEDFRYRLTASFYSSEKHGTRDYIYGGDRAGGRYYQVLEGGDFSGRFAPGFSRAPVGGYLTAFQINPFVKFKGLEFFGVLETASNGNKDNGGAFTQVGLEALYRFGAEENLFVGGRYNTVSGEEVDGAAKKEISRLNLGAGWFMTKNVLAKIEYVNQQYDGDGWINSPYEAAQFKGIMIEAAIGF